MRWASLLVVALALVGCSAGDGQGPPTQAAIEPGTAAKAAAPKAWPIVRFPSGNQVTVEVQVEPQERALGLMFRESLAEDRGMLFVSEQPEPSSFWMKNCNFPIDIVWLDEELRFVSGAWSAPPCRSDPCPNFEPAGPALFVLEVAAGVAERENLEPGQQFTVANLPVHRFSDQARAAAEAASR